MVGLFLSILFLVLLHLFWSRFHRNTPLYSIRYQEKRGCRRDASNWGSIPALFLYLHETRIKENTVVAKKHIYIYGLFRTRTLFKIFISEWVASVIGAFMLECTFLWLLKVRKYLKGRSHKACLSN